MFPSLFEIIGIALATILLKNIIKLSYMAMFLGRTQPYLWILSLAALGIGYTLLSTIFPWGLTVFQWSTIITFFWAYPEKGNKKDADSMYVTMGIKNGRILYKIGIWVFLFSSIITWIVCYAQVAK